MKKIFLFLYFVFILAGAKSQQWEWAIQETVRKFAVDSAGNVFTQNDSTIKRFNSNGIFHWQKQFSGDLLICAMVADNSGNLYVAGRFTGFSIDTNHFTSNGNRDIFFCKIDSLGILEWNQIIGGANYDNVTDLYLNKQKKILICGDAGQGTIIGSTTFSTADFFTARYDLNGNFELLIHFFGGSAWEVSADTNGNIYQLGGVNTSHQTLDFGNGTTFFGYGEYGHHFIAKYNSGGDVLWAKDLGDNYYRPFENLGVDKSGDFYLTKWRRYSGFDLTKFDTAGNFIWNQNTWGIYGNCYSLNIDNDNFIWLTGDTWGDPFTGLPFIWEFDPTNNLRGAIPATKFANGNNISNDYNNNIYVSGSFNDTAIFGNTTLLASAGNYFLAKMHRNSNIITSISKTNVLCNSQCTVTVTVTISGGQSPYTYLWMPGGQTTATVTDMCAGTYTYTVADSIGNITTSNVIITQPTPLLLSETHTNLCDAQCTGTVILTVSGGKPPYTFNGLTTGLCAGAYTYTVSDANGCTAATIATITQPTVINSNATATTSAFCMGGCTDLSINATGGTPGYTYLWMPGSLTNSTHNVCPNETTTYTCTVTDLNSCEQNEMVTVTVNALPSITASAADTNTFINGSTDLLIGTPAGGIFSGAGVSGTNFNPSIAGIGTWPVTYTYTDENGCIDSATVNITVDMSTGIAMNGGEEAGLEIYPNPTSGIFIINLKNKTAETKICVYDALGKCVFDKVSKNDKEKIDLSGQPKGIYTLEIESDGKSDMKKIVLQ